MSCVIFLLMEDVGAGTSSGWPAYTCRIYTTIQASSAATECMGEVTESAVEEDNSPFIWYVSRQATQHVQTITSENPCIRVGTWLPDLNAGIFAGWIYTDIYVYITLYTGVCLHCKLFVKMTEKFTEKLFYW